MEILNSQALGAGLILILLLVYPCALVDPPPPALVPRTLAPPVSTAPPPTAKDSVNLKAVNAIDRHAFLRGAPHDGLVTHARLSGQSATGAPALAADGVRGDLSGAAHQRRSDRRGPGAGRPAGAILAHALYQQAARDPRWIAKTLRVARAANRIAAKRSQVHRLLVLDSCERGRTHSAEPRGPLGHAQLAPLVADHGYQ